MTDLLLIMASITAAIFCVIGIVSLFVRLPRALRIAFDSYALPVSYGLVAAACVAGIAGIQ